MIREIETEFQHLLPRAENVKSFRFRAPPAIDFRPGQFFQLFVRWKGEELSHYFSFSNSPTEKGYFEFTKRLSESVYSQALLALQPRASVRMKLPLGQFVFEGAYPWAAFLSGGIGITPIRSICRYLTDSGKTSDTVVLYSARNEQDLIFREDFDEMQRRNRFLRMVYSLTDQAPPSGWKGRTGRICGEMVRSEIPDFSRRLFFVCGPPRMVTAITGVLQEELRLPPEKVICENFLGY